MAPVKKAHHKGPPAGLSAAASAGPPRKAAPTAASAVLTQLPGGARPSQAPPPVPTKAVPSVLLVANAKARPTLTPGPQAAQFDPQRVYWASQGWTEAEWEHYMIGRLG